jgi:hypothetical protein
MATKKQVPGVIAKEITQEHLKDPNLTELNEYFRELATMANIVAGVHGPIPLTVDMDMQENNLLGVKAIITGASTLTGTEPTVPPGQVGLGSRTAPTATAGAGQAVPGTVLGYLIANVGGIQVKIPYFKV